MDKLAPRCVSPGLWLTYELVHVDNEGEQQQEEAHNSNARAIVARGGSTCVVDRGRVEVKWWRFGLGVLLDIGQKRHV